MMRDLPYDHSGGRPETNLGSVNWQMPRKTTVGIILIMALVAFEIFNFDTTRFALLDLMGDVRFMGLHWATILAIAFCSIDFAGLVHLFTPENLLEERKEVWYLMGAWLLGATMNAMMTWWAVSLTLLNHNLGNEVLSREQLLFYVPIFVAVLVWLTRILFIGAFTVAGNHIFEFDGIREQLGAARQAATRQPVRATRPTAMPKREPQPSRALDGRPGLRRVDESVEDEIAERQRPSSQPVRSNSNNGTNRSRVRQRPPMPNGPARRMPVHASPRERH
jgi:hypothetical protein